MLLYCCKTEQTDSTMYWDINIKVFNNLITVCLNTSLLYHAMQFLIALPCIRISKPTFGIMNCTGFVTDSVCNFSCSLGFELQGLSRRVCLSSTTWSGHKVSCKRKTYHVHYFFQCFSKSFLYKNVILLEFLPKVLRHLLKLNSYTYFPLNPKQN